MGEPEADPAQPQVKMAGRYLRRPGEAHYRGLVGVGGIGWGLMFQLCGDGTLGRNESRPARLLDCRDYCKLHIIAHNVAVLMGASQAAGFHVVPIGKVGRDARGAELREEMRGAGMEVSCVEVAEGRPTTMSVCFQYPDGSGGNITSIECASMAVRPEDVDRAEARLSPPLSGYFALAAPEAPLETRIHFLQRAREWGSYTVASFASAEMQAALSGGAMECIDLLALNQDELEALLGRSVEPDDIGASLDECAKILRARQPAMRIVVTAGSNGAFALGQGRWQHCPALPVTLVSTAGAGDALLAGVISALAVGVPLTVEESERPSDKRVIKSGLEFGVLVAGLKVQSPHTINPDLNVDSLFGFAAEQGFVLGGALAEAVQLHGGETVGSAPGL